MLKERYPSHSPGRLRTNRIMGLSFQRRLFLFAVLWSLSVLTPAQIVVKEPLSERITGYKLEVSLDTVAKTVSGDMEAYWVNISSDTVPEVRMHLYMNAFRSNRSTFFREGGGSPGTKEIDPGWTDIRSLFDREGNDLLPYMDYISPDDGNSEDKTVIRINLPDRVLPGDTVYLRISFETKLPSQIIRTGFNDDFFFVAQWFPKFGVYEPAGMRYSTEGGWNCHQYHAHSEFYSNHSVYDVTITLPSSYVVGTGGLLLSEEKRGVLKTMRFRAEDIVDFAWTAWPGYKVFTDKWKHVDITLLIPEARTEQVDRQLTAVRNALEYFERNVGPYPWPHLTFIDPPSKGGGAGGMEYTTLFTSGSSDKMPEFLYSPEMVTVHEFGHAYFMGIIATNEFEEPWMDEGINSYWEQRIMDSYYGSGYGMVNHRLLKVSDRSLARRNYLVSPLRQVASNYEFSWNYPQDSYNMLSYQKASVWLHTLTGIIGEETINDVFREYYRKWAFRHPCTRDFINVVNEVVAKQHGETFGKDMNWFFDQTLFGTGLCDYKVFMIRNHKYRKPTGRTDTIDIDLPEGADPDSLFISTVQLQRLGEVMLPVDVLIGFTDGTEIREKWDGRARFRDFTYKGKREVEWVRIDPEFRIIMDVNYINNSITEKPDLTPVRRIANKILAFVQFYLSIFLL